VLGRRGCIGRATISTSRSKDLSPRCAFGRINGTARRPTRPSRNFSKVIWMSPWPDKRFLVMVEGDAREISEQDMLAALVCPRLHQGDVCPATGSGEGGGEGQAHCPGAAADDASKKSPRAGEGKIVTLGEYPHAEG